MLKTDGYKKDVYFGWALGAFLGFIDGVLINFIYYNQLNTPVLKLVYIFLSFSFYSILGAIAGFVFCSLFALLRLEKIKKVFLAILILTLTFVFLGFYTNIFTNNAYLTVYTSLFEFDNHRVEVFLAFFSLIATFLLYRFYKKADRIITLGWRNFIFLLVATFLLDVGIWIFLGSQPQASAYSVSNTDLKNKGNRPNENFELASDFVPPKNLIIIIIDALRADHLGVYGYYRDTSPFIDKFSTEGVVFENAIVQRPKTSPSVASLFTGLYPINHGIRSSRMSLPHKYFTLAESFLKQGFITQSVVANANISSRFNFHQGFMNYISVQGKGKNKAAYTAAVKWLEQKREKPFFLYLHLIDPHTPYNPPKEFDKFKPDENNSPIVDIRKVTGDFRFIDGIVWREGRYDLDYYVSKYDGEIRYTDDLIRRFMDKLDQLNLTEETLIVISSDHGEALGEHGYFFEHGIFPYEDCVRVPFILVYKKGNLPVKRVQQTIELIDVYPTVHEMMKLSYDKNKIQGMSMVPLLFGKKTFHKRAFLEAGKSAFGVSYAIRDERWKLIFNSWLPTPNQLLSFDFLANLPKKLRMIVAAGYYPQRENYELYDIIKDPQETLNLYQPGSKLVFELKRDLASKIKNKTRNIIYQVPLEQLSEKVKNELRTLGYIQ